MNKVKVEPGWHQNLSNNFYHNESMGSSSSLLKQLLEDSPAKVMYNKKNPTPPSESMRLGTAFHTLTMEPDKFHDENVILPTMHWKATQEAMMAHPEKNIISQSQYDAAQQMADNVLAHPSLKLFFADGIAESSIFQWYNGTSREDQTPYKEMLKVRPDFIPRGYDVLIDLKSARDASFTGFGQAVIEFKYDLSAAMYKFLANNCQELLDHQGIIAFTRFIFVVAENTPPYQVAWYELSEKNFYDGGQFFETAMFRLYRAKRDKWPPYMEECQILELPSYSTRLKTI